jgi:heme-degrading monooxygenase HmoA
MFARMTILQLKPETIDSAVRLFRTSVIPGAKEQRGYRGACFLVDRGAGKGIAVTFWRTEKDALANEQNLFYQEQLVKFLGFFSGPPIREGYTVAVHALDEPVEKRSPAKGNRRKRRS